MRIFRSLLTALAAVLCITNVSFAGGIRLFKAGSAPNQLVQSVAKSRFLKVDPAALQAARASGSFTIEGVLLPATSGIPQSVDLELSEFSVTGPGTKVILQVGTQEIIAPLPTVKTYHGKVAGMDNTLAYLAIEENGKVTGFIRFAGEHFTIGTIKESPYTSIITAKSSIPNISDLSRCDMTDEQLFDPANSMQRTAYSNSLKKNSQTPQTATKSAEVAFDADDECYHFFGDDETSLTNYLTARLGAITTVYENEVDCAVTLGRLKIYTTPDPYTSSDLNALLDNFTTYWKNNNSSVSRTIAHLISKQDLGSPGGAEGLAWLAGLCRKDIGYAVTRIMGSESFPTVDESVIAHEIGHNFGSAHTHNCQAYPPTGIDHCVTAEGAGCSWTPVQTLGSIMSYCNNKTFSFDTPTDHRVIEVIKQNIADAPCLGSVAVAEIQKDSIVFKPKVAIGIKKDTTVGGIIKSTGTVDLKITNMSIANDGGDTEFVLKSVPKFPVTLAPEALLGNITVTFQPHNRSVRYDTLNIYHNGSGSPAKVVLAGTGAGPSVEEIAQFSYGDIYTNAWRDTIFAYIKNVGDAPLHITKKYLDGENAAAFSILSSTGAEVVAPDSTAKVTIRFKPDSLGTRTAFLNVEHDADPGLTSVYIDANVLKLDQSLVKEHSVEAPKITVSPNPFSGKLTIEIETALSMPAEISSVSVVDALGRHVATLFNGKLEGNVSRFDWTPDASTSEGSYTLIMKIGEQNWTRQIAFIK